MAVQGAISAVNGDVNSLRYEKMKDGQGGQHGVKVAHRSGVTGDQCGGAASARGNGCGERQRHARLPQLEVVVAAVVAAAEVAAEADVVGGKTAQSAEVRQTRGVEAKMGGNVVCEIVVNVDCAGEAVVVEMGDGGVTATRYATLMH